MDKKLRDKWVKALTSRKFKQGTGSLHLKHEGEAPTFCCLGVLCEVAGVKPTEKPSGSYTVYQYDGMSGVLSAKLMKEFGIDGDALDTLVGMNDDDGAKFYQIARWIKRNL